MELWMSVKKPARDLASTRTVLTDLQAPKKNSLEERNPSENGADWISKCKCISTESAGVIDAMDRENIPSD